MAQFTVTVNQQNNQPPSMVGDGSATIEYGQALVFTRDMFTTNTNPPYSDPEGDAAWELLVQSLPIDGELQYNSLPVNINDTILFTDIDAGLLQFIPDNGLTSNYNVNFQFQISDSGSFQFVG